MKPILFVLLGASLARALADDPTEPEELVSLYGQCGGYAYVKLNVGPTKCVPGAYCQQINFYYAWCFPIPTTEPIPTPTSALN